ncbi:MAG: hypothetical protein MK101_04440 [Phycisphaerales bacterium]|nr:hypothetical protein [Phycisphaerales bacterium]
MSLRCSVRAFAALVLSLAGCQGPAPVTPEVLPPGVYTASPIAPEIHGAGVELIRVQVEADVSQVHEALIAAGAQRDTTAQEWRSGLEALTIDTAVFEPLLRSLHPVGTPDVTWMGTPVRWVRVGGDSACTISARGWPLSMESSAVGVVDVRVETSEPLRRERLVLPGQMLVLVPGGTQYPLSTGGQVTSSPITSLLTRGGTTVIAFRPRFGPVSPG